MAQPMVYILLTRSGTCFSRLIHLATGDGYTHASIGLDGPEGPFYSFGRKHPRLALPAGLVEEAPAAGRDREMPLRLYELQVSQQVYRRLRRRLAAMYGQRERYHYNLLGALGCFVNLPLRRRHHFFCSQFVAGLLEECGAVTLDKSPDLTRPADLCRVGGVRAVA